MLFLTKLVQRMYQTFSVKKKPQLTSNEEIKVALTNIFPTRRLKHLTPGEISSKLTKWLHNFCTQKFGVKSINQKHSPSSPRPPRKNKRLEALRKRKKACRAAHKALVRAGLQQSEEAAELLGKWKRLLRQHNRLRLELAQNRQVRDSKKAVKCFRKDPNDFARKLFNGAAPAEGPAFSAKVAEAFFPR